MFRRAQTVVLADMGAQLRALLRSVKFELRCLAINFWRVTSRDGSVARRCGLARCGCRSISKRQNQTIITDNAPFFNFFNLTLSQLRFLRQNLKMTVPSFETIFAVPMTCDACIKDIEGSLHQLSGTVTRRGL